MVKEHFLNKYIKLFSSFLLYAYILFIIIYPIYKIYSISNIINLFSINNKEIINRLHNFTINNNISDPKDILKNNNFSLSYYDIYKIKYDKDFHKINNNKIYLEYNNIILDIIQNTISIISFMFLLLNFIIYIGLQSIEKSRTKVVKAIRPFLNKNK